LTVSRFLLLLAAALLGAVLVLVLTGDRLPELTGERLAEARARWAAQAPASYRLALEMTGSELERGLCEVKVEKGEVVAASRDGRVIERDTELYAVPGLFTLLQRELEMANDPRQAQAPAGYRVYVFARFDRRMGTPLRFRRVIGGSSRWAEWRVTALEVASPPADGH